MRVASLESTRSLRTRKNEYVLRNLLLLPVCYAAYDFLLRSRFPDALAVQSWDELMLVFFLLLVAGDLARERTAGWVKPVAVFFVLGLVSMVGAGFNGRSTVDGFRIMYQPVLWFVYFLVIFEDESVLEKAKSLMVWIGAFLAIHGILQIFFQVPMMGNWVDTTDVIGHRAFSILGSPNSLGAFMVMQTGFLSALILAEKRKRKRVILGTLLLISLAALYLTYSRGALLALAAATGFVLLLFNRRLLLYFTFFGTGLLLLVDQAAYRLYNLFTPDTVSNMLADGRLAKWAEGLRAFSEAPVFGKGYGQFGGSISIKYGISNFYADNFYLKTLAENGVFGFLAFTGVMGYLLYKLLGRGRSGFLIGLSVGLLGFLLHNLVDNLYGIPTLTFYFYLYLAMGMRMIGREAEGVMK